MQLSLASLITADGCASSRLGMGYSVGLGAVSRCMSLISPHLGMFSTQTPSYACPLSR